MIEKQKSKQFNVYPWLEPQLSFCLIKAKIIVGSIWKAKPIMYNLRTTIFVYLLYYFGLLSHEKCVVVVVLLLSLCWCTTVCCLYVTIFMLGLRKLAQADIFIHRGRNNLKHDCDGSSQINVVWSDKMMIELRTVSSYPLRISTIRATSDRVLFERLDSAVYSDIRAGKGWNVIA